jgi:excisionase family DNA binding protein
MNMFEMEKLLKPVEVAGMLKVHVSTVRRLYQDGELTYRKLGHRTVRIFQSSVEAFLKRDSSRKPRIIPEVVTPKNDFAKLPPAGI